MPSSTTFLSLVVFSIVETLQSQHNTHGLNQGVSVGELFAIISIVIFGLLFLGGLVLAIHAAIRCVVRKRESVWNWNLPEPTPTDHRLVRLASRVFRANEKNTLPKYTARRVGRDRGVRRAPPAYNVGLRSSDEWERVLWSWDGCKRLHVHVMNLGERRIVVDTMVSWSLDSVIVHAQNCGILVILTMHTCYFWVLSKVSFAQHVSGYHIFTIPSSNIRIDVSNISRREHNIEVVACIKSKRLACKVPLLQIVIC